MPTSFITITYQKFTSQNASVTYWRESQCRFAFFLLLDGLAHISFPKERPCQMTVAQAKHRPISPKNLTTVERRRTRFFLAPTSSTVFLRISGYICCTSASLHRGAIPLTILTLFYPQLCENLVCAGDAWKELYAQRRIVINPLPLCEFC